MYFNGLQNGDLGRKIMEYKPFDREATNMILTYIGFIIVIIILASQYSLQ